MEKTKNRAILVLITAIAFYTIIVLYSDVSLIYEKLSLIKWEYYLLILPLTFLSLAIRAVRYHLIIKDLKIPLRFSDSFLIYLSGFSMAITPGGFGTIIKSHLLKQKTGKSYSSTTPIIIYEKLLELITITIIIGTLLVWSDLLASKIVFIIGIILSAIIFSFLKFPSSQHFLFNVFNKISFLRKYLPDVEQFSKSSSVLLKTKAFTKNLLLSIVAQIPIIVALVLLFESIEISIEPFVANQIFFTSILIGTFSFIPGGIVVIESGLLGLLLTNGIELISATVSVLLIRLVFLWFSIILGLGILKIVMSKKWLEKK